MNHKLNKKKVAFVMIIAVLVISLGVFLVRRAAATLRFAADIMLALSPDTLFCIRYFKLLRTAITQAKHVKNIYNTTDDPERNLITPFSPAGAVAVLIWEMCVLPLQPS